MKTSKTLLAAAALGASSIAMATPEVSLDFSMENAADMVQTIGDSTVQGYFIWADTTYNNLFLAWADHDSDGADHYYNKLVIDNGFDNIVDLTIDGSNPIVSTTAFGSGATVEVLENTGNFVDAYEVAFDPSITLGQDLTFWLASEDDSVDECADFGLADNCGNASGQFVDSIGINIWDSAEAKWFTEFQTEVLDQNFNWPGTTDTVLAQKFELTRVPEPAGIALFGLGLAGLAMARRKRG